MTDLAYDQTPQAAQDKDECPSWCCGCDENTELHANEYDGPGKYGTDDDWDAITRTVQDRHDGSPAAVELAVHDKDGNEAAIQLTADQAYELIDALRYNADCALRIA